MPPKNSTVPKKSTVKDTVNTPLKGSEVLDSMKDEFDKDKFNEYKNALKIYSSCSDITKLSRKERTRVFPAVFYVGDAFLETQSPQVLKWFTHALIIGKDMEQNPRFAASYLEMADIFQMNKVDEAFAECVEQGLKMINQVEEAQLDDYNKYIKGRLLQWKGLLQEEEQHQAGPLQKESLAKKAIETLSQSAALLESVIGGEKKYDVVPLLHVYEMLNRALRVIKDSPQGIIYAKKCLDLIDKFISVNHKRGSPIAHYLAKTLAEEARFDEAMVYAKKYEEIILQDELLTSQMLASCKDLYRLIDSMTALENIEKAENLAKKNPDATPESFGELFIEKARCHFSLGNFKEAKECFEESVEYNKTFGDDSKKMANCYYTGAEILKGSKLFIAETKENYLKALAIYRALSLSAYVETVEALINFGAFLHENGEYLETIKLLLEAKETCEKCLPQRKDLLENCHNVLGMAQVFAGETHSGLHTLEEAVKICEETGNESGKLAFHYFSLAKACSMNNDVVEAMMYARKIAETDGEDSKWIRLITDLVATAMGQWTPKNVCEMLDKYT